MRHLVAGQRKVCPDDTLVLAVNAADGAVLKHYRRAIGHLTDARDASRRQPALLPQQEFIGQLHLCLEEVQALTLDVRPEVLLRVDEQERRHGAACHLRQALLNAAVENLAHRVHHDISARSAYPQHAGGIFLDALHIAVGQCHAVTEIALVCAYVVAVIAIQAAGRAKPHKASRVLADGIDLRR